jgi:very-short-patch-repair endonuclease
MLERTVSSLLSEKGIEFIPQCGRSVFAWLGGLSLDFYLPRYNVAIECQGGQHFAPIEHFGGIDNYNDTVERDNRKRALCEENGVRLIYFTNIDGTEGCITSESRLLEEATSEGASACP